MSAASSLITKIRAHGISLHREGGRLIVEAPAGVITPDLRVELGRLKQELLSQLDLESRKESVEDAAANAICENAGLLAIAYVRYKAVQRATIDQPGVPTSKLALSSEPSVHGVVE